MACLAFLLLPETQISRAPRFCESGVTLVFAASQKQKAALELKRENQVSHGRGTTFFLVPGSLI
jgi:hypothetical protein